MEKYLEDIYAILNKLDKELTTEQFVAIHELIDDYPHSPDLYVFMNNFYSECFSVEQAYDKILETITHKFFNTSRHLRNSLIHLEKTTKYIETVFSKQEIGLNKIYGEYQAPNLKLSQRFEPESESDWDTIFSHSRKFHTVIFEQAQSVKTESIENGKYYSIEVKKPSRKRHSENGYVFSTTIPSKRDQWFNAENGRSLSQVATAI